MTVFSPPPGGATVLDHPPTDHDRTARAMALAVHGLFLLSVLLPVLPLLIGVALAYTARGAAQPPWRSHFEDAIATFWICLLLALLGLPLLALFMIGVIPMVAAEVLLVFKATRGVLRALSWQGL